MIRGVASVYFVSTDFNPLESKRVIIIGQMDHAYGTPTTAGFNIDGLKSVVTK